MTISAATFTMRVHENCSRSGVGDQVPPADGISNLAVSVFENTVATISDVRVDVCQPP